MAIDWTDETLHPLDDLARIAFPAGGVTGESLKRRARQGRLRVHRPGKRYLSSLAAVWQMIQACRVTPTQRPARPEPPDAGLAVSSASLDAALNALGDRQNEERRRLRDEERARTEPERRRLAKERRSARSKVRYRKQKAARHVMPPRKS